MFLMLLRKPALCRRKTSTMSMVHVVVLRKPALAGGKPQPWQCSITRSSRPKRSVRFHPRSGLFNRLHLASESHLGLYPASRLASRFISA